MIGLDEVMAELYAEGRQPNKETGEEILIRLENHNNYIPTSARTEYRGVLLKEYRDYVAAQKDKIPSKGGAKDEPRKKDK